MGPSAARPWSHGAPRGETASGHASDSRVPRHIWPRADRRRCRGPVKVVSARDGTVLGVQIVSPLVATELIRRSHRDRGMGALAGEVGDITQAHPSLAEAIREAALAVVGMPLHGHAR